MNRWLFALVLLSIVSLLLFTVGYIEAVNETSIYIHATIKFQECYTNYCDCTLSTEEGICYGNFSKNYRVNDVVLVRKISDYCFIVKDTDLSFFVLGMLISVNCILFFSSKIAIESLDEMLRETR